MDTTTVKTAELRDIISDVTFGISIVVEEGFPICRFKVHGKNYINEPLVDLRATREQLVELIDGLVAMKDMLKG